MGFDHLSVNARHIIETIGISDRSHFCQVQVTLLVLGQQNHLVTVVLMTAVGVVLADVELASHYGLELLVAFLLAQGRIIAMHRLHKMEGPHHVPTISQCYCRHTIGRGGSHQVSRGRGRLQYRELGVVVKVNERSLHQSLTLVRAHFHGTVLLSLL